MHHARFRGTCFEGLWRALCLGLLAGGPVIWGRDGDPGRGLCSGHG